MIRVFWGVFLGPKWQIHNFSHRRQIPEGVMGLFSRLSGLWATWEPFIQDFWVIFWTICVEFPIGRFRTLSSSRLDSQASS